MDESPSGPNDDDSDAHDDHMCLAWSTYTLEARKAALKQAVIASPLNGGTQDPTKKTLEVAKKFYDFLVE